ncbi:MAG TPA: hypothetical protein PLZ93_06685 [Nocardioides sp.]|uniref:hypothetical protein n=1 Tax=uncultured Nocardioides sp. TaxID=198441 RepID=UPI000EEA9DA8|nr:hypothetical protein [uncultured Nocardioides sp.]HCB06389.1 hypothetical protein [Nocardioides sp.]HRD59870.1 hypothetical protein [Nocardioides sp.]HRI95279.1 hypothetical protein [Nocardioides sp.]HRK45146.1 hypothetical protein [Nocardioides sp.]
MSEEFRPIEVVDVGWGDPTPVRPPRERQGVLLTLITLGVLVCAACGVFTAWTVYESRQDEQTLYCARFLRIDDQGDAVNYDDMADEEQRIMDQLDCDVPGR